VSNASPANPSSTTRNESVNTTGAVRPRRDPALALEPDEFRRIGHDLVDRVAEFLESLPARRVTPGESPDVVRAAVHHDAPMPQRGEAPDALIASAADLLLAHSLFNGHPRFFGYITSPPAPIGILGELLAAAVNANAGAWVLSPAATEIEAQTIRWIADLIGYRQGCGGLLVSGGNMANFVGLLAARAARATWDIRVGGLAAPEARPLAIYASRETHTWIQKGADLFGLGTNAIRWIDTDASLRMDVDALERALAADSARGVAPLMVVGTAGSVSTGAVDPLRRIADTCRRVGAWFHVDGAYGGFAAAAPGASAEFAALCEADSVAIDPHKWLYAPLEAGCLLARSPDVLRDAFSYHPPYYHFGVEATNFVDLGPQNSRGFRALKVWLALRHAGREGYARMIADDIRLSERLFELASRHEHLEAVTQSLSITTFRYVPAGLRPKVGDGEVETYLNALNQTLLDDLQRGGAAFVSNAVVGGRYLLRACIVNFHTTDDDVAALPGIVVEAGRALDQRMRPAGLR
jgi:glutamate/tyrosine decarboxylase-like PLP-dependent enzyme